MQIIGGIYKGKKIKVPEGIRPTSGMVREAVFNIWQGKVEGARFLDLFAGAGAIGLEALSRGAEEVLFVEKSGISSKSLRENIRIIDIGCRADLIERDALTFLEKADLLAFDLIFLDPPYFPEDPFLALKILLLIDEKQLLKKGGELIVETGCKTAWKQGELKNLIFKEERKYGKTLLRRYITQMENN